MFRNRTDHISNLIGLYRRLESSNIESLLDNPTPSITNDIESIRSILKAEIEYFSSHIIKNVLDIKSTIDFEFAEKVIDYDPNLFGEILAESIKKFYQKIGFDAWMKIIANIKNLSSVLDGVKALFDIIIVDGEKHRNEACELTKKLEDITLCEEFDELSEEQMLQATKMIQLLKPYARPIVKKIFNFPGMPLTKEEEESGVSYPIFSRTGNWSEHHLLMGLVANSFEEKQNKYKKSLKK